MNSIIQENETVSIGEKVADFKAQAYMPDGSFKEVSLSDYQGKWVVVFFYPLDFTFVCPTEIRAFSGAYAEFKKAGAEVLSVSTDSVYSHTRKSQKDSMCWSKARASPCAELSLSARTEF